MEEKDRKAKYKAIIPRSFKTKFELYLLYKLENESSLENINKDEFVKFKITPQIVKDYETNLGKSDDDIIGVLKVKEIDDIIYEYVRKDKTADKKKVWDEYLNEYRGHFSEVLKEDDFLSFYREAEEERVCIYCGVSDADIAKLRSVGLIKTKQRKGISMEIDRKNSNSEYTLDNMLLACHWCNNAKTDEFSVEEFWEIGDVISRIWKRRNKLI